MKTYSFSYRLLTTLFINITRIIKQVLYKIKFVFPFFLLSMITSGVKENSSEFVIFDILNKDKRIGYIHIEKVHNNSTTIYKLNSSVETWLLLKFKAEGKESYVYRNDTLIYSSVYRKLNNKVKVDQTLKYSEGIYSATSGKQTSPLNLNAITCNLVKLYFLEPSNITKVYCDKLKMKLELIKLDDGAYKVKFPNGGYNVFHYKNGKISHVDAVGTFFKVKLKKINKDSVLHSI